MAVSLKFIPTLTSIPMDRELTLRRRREAIMCVCGGAKSRIEQRREETTRKSKENERSAP